MLLQAQAFLISTQKALCIAVRGWNGVSMTKESEKEAIIVAGVGVVTLNDDKRLLKKLEPVLDAVLPEGKRGEGARTMINKEISDFFISLINDQIEAYNTKYTLGYGKDDYHEAIDSVTVSQLPGELDSQNSR